ncbi:MAG: hypothetical protein A3G33_01325 [Omnitrophica bacterium RIFCSPLOWO2_12_FULL_44_17]|uniref:Uncharacterized protein n=1 Tax=Candidatus Danuiimicrobium aquiferis TaxID=1801832 RepID=A0A1G1L1L6_9BACT|nr:MAG: hypothetical protein A3B72_00555 [Omnitrophica bacterium RIFCSPHIGHO2_02_FULL_45_28]OGW88207.1 MAG: hypothetical protein A3E74_02195 [Omnitrophica bacterium RIFCSPHIGHO2_12_FULL_44_12]OGW99045.1 MAG: hypothetical protein A3G33_01325 [Omnitrophica bacterium RIFCSPLOWO2_12_FULL_44_17]OGX04121.1 MAG: hypothetical protein A3J12_10975 [Omnitrophica bacterium RIFCSPLOWO2_02_FULL_44_11]
MMKYQIDLKRIIYGAVFVVFAAVLFFRMPNGFGGFQRDLIKETQTEPVQVTEELLKRESETGPASPTFKMPDANQFLTDKPYEESQEEEVVTEKSEEKTKWWDKWFNWNDEKNE